MKIYDVLIIGAGPSGISLACKLSEKKVNVAIIEYSSFGGKVNIAPLVENYPGQKSITGPDLAYIFYKRLKDSNVEIITDEILDLTKNENIFNLQGKNSKYFAKVVYIASGTKERKLGFYNEDALFGKGISYCAICDGHFFKNKDVAIIGGGNAALKEAIYLAPIVKKLYLIHRRNEFRGLTKLVSQLLEYKNVNILTPYVPVEILGDEKVEGLIIQNKETSETLNLVLDGIFPLIGQLPNTTFVNIENVLDENKTIPVDNKKMTKVNGLFAGGDVTPRDIRQIYLAEYDGIVASKSILEFLGIKNV